MAKTAFPAVGIVTTLTTPDHHAWILLGEVDASPAVIASLLAALILNDAEGIIPVPFMPDRAPGALLLKTGEFRTARGFVLAPWAVKEIDRLGRVLREAHADYVREVVAALHQRESGAFHQLRDAEIFAKVNIPSARIGPTPPAVDVDVSSSERAKFGLRREQVVAQDYARNRFMRQLSEEQLARRTEDIVGNMHVIDEAGLVSLDLEDPLLSYWIDRLAEMQAEMTLRHGPYPSGWDQNLIQPANLPPSMAAAGSSLATLRLVPQRRLGEQFLVKYGMRTYLEPMLAEGAVKIFPATSYDDPSLNVAVRDDEQCAEIEWDSTAPFNDLPLGSILWPSSRRTVRAEIKTNYYAYCLAKRLSPRLLLDFEYDACLVIHEPAEFIERVSAGVLGDLPHWQLMAQEVTYFDPLLVTPHEIQVVTSKHFRYAYQEEFRLAWLPPSPREALPELELHIGPLDDIAELVVPSPTATPPS